LTILKKCLLMLLFVMVCSCLRIIEVTEISLVPWSTTFHPISIPPNTNFHLIFSKQSHVERGVKLLGKFQNLHFETVLHVQQDCFVASSFLCTLLFISTDEVDGQSLCSETTCSSHSMEISVSFSWEIFIKRKLP